MVITEKIDFSTSSQLHTSGGFADTKSGQYKGCTVAVKTLRIAMADNFDKIRNVSGKKVAFAISQDDAEVVPQKFCKEVILWNSLSHPNVLKLVGVLGGIEKYQFSTVSEWMVHGNIMEYISKTSTNRLELVRILVFWLIASFAESRQ